jgi:hypothetical protein
MKRKQLDGIKLNQVVYILTERRWDKVVYIDDHVQGSFCMAGGGRYRREEIDA